MRVGLRGFLGFRVFVVFNCGGVKMSSETDFLLLQWGYWQSGRAEGSCTSPMLVVMDLMDKRAPCPVPQIDDDSALLIDRAVARLKLHDRGMFELIWARYVLKMAVAQMAREMGENRKIIDKRLAGAVSWIDCCLNFFAQE